MENQTPSAAPSKPHTPPATPPQQTPRRRSWFGFASPSSASTSPLSASQRGGVEAPVREGQDVELGLIARSTPAGPSALSLDANRSQADTTGQSPVADEILTIDGNPELMIKNKTKNKRGSQPSDEEEALRMEDLAGKRLARQVSPSSVTISSPDPGGTAIITSKSETIANPPSQHSAPTSPTVTTDSTPKTRRDHAPRSKKALATPDLPPRFSSRGRIPTPITPFPIPFLDKPSPPLPLDRPLPALPRSSSDLTPPPVVPKSIVVTPSSPKALEFPMPRPATKPLPKRRESLQVLTPPDSRTPSASRNPPKLGSTPIGLGLPVTLSSGSMPPPLLSAKQAVSSPLPSRSRTPSPAAKIGFVEPNIVKPTLVTNDSSGPEVKRTRIKRARSLSSLFLKPTPTSTPQHSRQHSPEPKEEVAEEVAPTQQIRSHSMLDWLGVRKSSKRQPSEGRLPASRDRAVSGSIQSGPEPARSALTSSEQIKGTLPRQSRSIGIDEKVPQAENSAEPDRQRSGRPDLKTGQSSSTITPVSGGKLNGIFARKTSYQVPNNDDSAIVPIPLRPGEHPVVDIRPRLHGPTSSNSSLDLPNLGPLSSPLYLPMDRDWASSPTTETEEMLFSPPATSQWRPGVRPWMDGAQSGSQSTGSSMSSPFGSLQDQKVLNSRLPPNLSSEFREGRVRSSSDAPRLEPAHISGHFAVQHHHDSARSAEAPSSLQSSPLTPQRPRLGSRSNSGNSAIIDRMRSMLGRNTTRSRSNTLQRQTSSDVEEFGALRIHDDWTVTAGLRPSSPLSSGVPSPSSAGRISGEEGQLALSGLPELERQIFLHEGPDRSRRTSISASMTSILADAQRPPSTNKISVGTQNPLRVNRVRASTISSSSSSYDLGGPLSPGLLPVHATPTRRGSAVLQRIANGRLGSGPTSPRQGASLFPLHPRSSVSTMSSAAATESLEDAASADFSPATSARLNTVGGSAAVGNARFKATTERVEGESPLQWLDRIVGSVHRSEIANVLAASSDAFHSQALRAYMKRFDFTHNALDVALRRLLMQMSLPRETQQIDRIIEAFATRYEEGEPQLFMQKDNTYVLAFSMMMLHTDAFNRNNKNKMTKADYVRNTRLDGVPPSVLETFFDNITFTPFVFVEDDAELRRGPLSAATTPSFTASFTPAFPGTSTPLKPGKIDVYDLIVRDNLDPLRVPVDQQIPMDSPFSCIGTRPLLDMDDLHRTFTQAHILQILPPPRRKSATLLSSTPNKAVPAEPEVILRVTKAGLLSRKDDTKDNNRKNRKWKSWSVILTGSQLLFFKDPTWALALLEQARSAVPDPTTGQPLLPPMTSFKPDEVLPVQDGIAVFDAGLDLPNTFRLIMPHARQYLLQAGDESEMNEWINLVNYASAFKTAGVRMRGSAMRKDQAVLAGAAAAASHRRLLHDAPNGSSNGDPRRAVLTESTPELSISSVTARTLTALDSHVKGTAILVDGTNDAPVHEGEQLEEVFTTVKAELAAGRGAAVKQPWTTLVSKGNRLEDGAAVPSQPSRADGLQRQINLLQTKVAALESELASSLRIARNLTLLTPFQRSTRDRLSTTIVSLGLRIRADRLQIAKFRIWIEILRKDLVREQREWALLRHVALQAAAKSLLNPTAVQDDVKDNNAPQQSQVPTLSLPFPDSARSRFNTEGLADTEEEGIRLGSSPGELPVLFQQSTDDLRRPTMSRQASSSSWRTTSSRQDIRRSSSDYFSVQTSGERRPSTDEESGHDHGHSTPIFDQADVEEDRNHTRESTVRAPAPPTAPLPDENGNTTPTMDHKVDDREQAEAWQNTRAARRVSLAEIPPEEISKLSKEMERRKSSVKRRDRMETSSVEKKQAEGLGPAASGSEDRVGTATGTEHANDGREGQSLETGPRDTALGMNLRGTQPEGDGVGVVHNQASL